MAQEFTTFMAGSGALNYGIVGFGDLENENAICQTVPNCTESFGGVGTFIDNKALICGGYYNPPLILLSSNQCYSWNSEVNLC